MSETSCDALIIGGGFYGAAIAIYLARQRGFERILLIEREKALLLRASYTNQARVHNGYHYPRSFTTAFRSRVNLPRFVRDWPQVVKRDFTKLYAIARSNSKVTARQFVRFCREIGASLEPATLEQRSWFEPKLIEDLFLTEEYAFNTEILAEWARAELAECGVEVRLETRVLSLDEAGQGIRVRCANAGGEQDITAAYVFNCTYSGLNQFGGGFPGTSVRLKHEITEMALMEMPAGVRDLGITVMDGPFFSAMPFPARRLHTLSHVRYTPHNHWLDEPGRDPYAKMDAYAKETRQERMVRDSARYMPVLLDARYADSLFEVKTVLTKNEGDDGRPILFERHSGMPRCFSVLGGKIDNIYDILEKLDAQALPL